MNGVSLSHPRLLAKPLLMLPFTLNIKNHATAADCSKLLWGLLFPLEFGGLFTP